MEKSPTIRLDDLEDQPVPHRVKMSGHGLGLLDYVLALLTKIPEEQIRQAVAEGRFQHESGEAIEADERLHFGQNIQVRLDRAVADDPFLPPPLRPLDILYQDEALLGVDKAPGLLSYPIGPRRVSALAIARRQLEAVGEADELRPLHRLDRETSGVLIMARSIEPDRRMKAAFKARALEKSYLALVRGDLRDAPEHVDAPIGPDEDGPIRIKMAIRGDGKSAQTELRVLHHFGNRNWGSAGCGYTWVEAIPRTGRTHQIRLHLEHLGHPLVGDKVYCDGGIAFLRRWDGLMDDSDLTRLEHPRHGLHAHLLSFEHPMTGQRLDLEAPLPQDLLEFTATRGGDPRALRRALIRSEK